MLAVTLLSLTPVMAQDAEGCKDHPLLSRMKDFHIDFCEDNYKQMAFMNSDGQETMIEGNLTHLIYMFNADSPNREPSTFQIVKNYSNAIAKIGGKKIYEDEVLGGWEVKKTGKTYNVMVSNFANYGGGEKIMQYDLDVMEMTAMVQEISANEMLDALNKNGFISLNILFETGKSSIQAESMPIVDQIFELVKNNAGLKVSIEGHTDNVGTAAGNKKLSADRAKAVMDALVAKGAQKTRLSSVGWGQEKPVGDNRTEDGRAQNRRVEIVKK